VTLGAAVTTGCEVSSQTTVSILTQSPTPGATMFYLLASPCRLLDTRSTAAVADGGTLNVAVGGRCGLPVGARSAVVNLTAVNPPAGGFGALYRADSAWPGTSTLSYRTGKTRANNAIVELAPNGTISLRNVGAATHFLIDVTGYFQ
jgi:hypothetical protein